MQLPLNQLARHLERELRSCYLICGDEPLLKQEALAVISQRGEQAGFTERLRARIEPGLDWSELLGEALQPSLFASTRQLHLELGGKMDDNARKALRELAQSPDLLLIVHGGKLDKRQQQSAWFKLLTQDGVFIPIWPLRSHELPGWFAERLRVADVKATPDALAMLGEMFEGNLLAAKQQVDQLALLFAGAQQPVTPQQVQQVAADQARLDVFQWLDALLEGDLPRALRALDSLRQEGVEPTLPLAVLARELTKLQQLGSSPSPAAMEKLKIWKARQPLVRKALTRITAPQLDQLLSQCASLDISLKTNITGGQSNQPFMALEQLTLACCHPHQAPQLWL